MKVMLALRNQLSVSLVVNVMFFLRSRRPSKNKRVMKIAANNDEIIPITRVVAKPLIGPSPKM